MSYLVLARKYRPQTFAEIVGQEHVTQTLTNAIQADRMAHAILFAGPRGTGKTTIARVLAKAMNCQDGITPSPCNQCRSCREITAGNATDVFEIDGASNNGVDQVRDLRENVKYLPQHSRYKIYIIDEVHMLSIAAFNALLKTLEEPPSHVLFFFATTEPHKIPLTILSRCQRHDLKRIVLSDISNHMALLCEKENIAMSLESLDLIAREAGGCMRDALSLLDQVVSFSAGPPTQEEILDILGVVDRKIMFDLSRAIFDKNVPAILKIIDDIYNRGHDLKKIYADLTTHFRNLFVVRLGKNAAGLVDCPDSEARTMQEQVGGMSEIYLGQMVDLLLAEEIKIKSALQPKLAFEMVCFKMLQLRPSLPIETLIEKAEILRKEFYRAAPAEFENPAPGNALPAGQPGRRETGNVPRVEAPAGASSEGHMAGESKDHSRSAAPPGGATGVAAHRDPSQVWHELYRAICKKHPSMASPLEKSGIREMTENKITLVVSGSRFSNGMISRKKELLAKICSDFFKRPMNLEIQSEIVEEEATNHRQHEQIKKKAMQHPAVADAVELFNGKIVDVKIL